MIIDASTKDSDTFNLTLTAANATQPIVKNIENVNVILDYFIGTATDIDMTNYSSSTVTLGSTKLGFNSTSGATGVGSNTVKAGSNVDTFTVAGLTTGTVDAGSVKTLSVTGTAGAANTIVINGDIKTGTGLVNTTSTKTTLDFTADSEVLYDPSAGTIATTVTGASDVILEMAAVDVVVGTSLVDETTAGTITLKTGGATFNTTNFALDKIIIDNTAAQAATIATGQTIETSADIATSLTIATTAITATTATLNLGHDLALLDVKDDKLVTTINNTDNNAIATFTADGEKVIITGSGNLTLRSADVKTLDASAATGELVISTEGSASTAMTILGTTGKNTVTLGGVAEIVSFTGQAGVDTIDATVTLAGTVAGNLGAGADVVKFNTLGAGTVALEGGDGTDILKITSGGSTTAATTWAVSQFEEIQLQKVADNIVDAVAVAMNSSQLDGTSYNFTTQETLDTVALTVTVDGATTDLSGLTFGTDDTVAITARAIAKDVIIGSAAKDTITAAAAEITYTGGAGDDTFSFATNNSTEASMSSITDYQAAASASDNDKLKVINTVLVADSTTDVSSVGTIFADKQETVNGVVKDGVLTLSGLAADLALVDTLAEMIDIAEHVAYNSVATTADNVAFEYAGDTYLLSTTAGDATDLVVKLSGVTGIDAVSTTAAADTILIA
jgi:hypothetical protein